MSNEEQEMLAALDNAGEIVTAGNARPLSRRGHAITVLVDNQGYLSWVLQNLARQVNSTARQMNGLDPRRLMMITVSKFLNHPNSWRLLVAQLANMSDDSFDAHWPDIKALVDAVSEYE